MHHFPRSLGRCFLKQNSIAATREQNLWPFQSSSPLWGEQQWAALLPLHIALLSPTELLGLLGAAGEGWGHSFLLQLQGSTAHGSPELLTRAQSSAGCTERAEQPGFENHQSVSPVPERFLESPAGRCRCHINMSALS